ncbi:MAG: cytochrome P450, partial [Nitrospirae bacterium]|nr:cytochrome P450 [Nitrospirota bacterium]
MSNQAIPAATLSGPPVSRWFGFFPEFRQDSLGFLLRCRFYGDVVKIPMGRMAGLLLRQSDPVMYLLNNPVDVKHVLVTNQDNYTKAPVPPVESYIFGQGVLHTEGAIHHHQRRLLLPFFHGDHVASYAGLITEKAAGLAASWPEGITVDIGREMTQLTLSVIWRLLFGLEVGAERTEVMQAVTTGQRLIKKQYDSLLAMMTPLWVPTRLHREFLRGHRWMQATIRRFIQDRRTTPHQTHDVLSLLLAATDAEGRPLGDKEIRDELFTFLLAGHETTAAALTWTWFLLSQFRTVRTRLARELETVLDGHLPTAADLPYLIYTKMIWDEALRLYPPAWLLHTRVNRDEDKLPSGIVLPAGARVFLSPWSLHRNPRWFPDPNRFDPDRFSEEAKRARPVFSYIPFGGGGRRCLGESFAELEGLLILATLASKVRLRLVE